MKRTMKLDAVTLAVMNNRLAAIAEEMGVVLGQTGFSPNIRARHDFRARCWRRRRLVAQAAYTSSSRLDAAFRARRDRTAELSGDVAAVNDPFAGGTICRTPLVAPISWQRAPPVRVRRQPRPSRRYRRDGAGLMAPGEIYQEGFRLPPVHIMRAGKPARDVLGYFSPIRGSRGARGRPARANRGARCRCGVPRAGGSERASASRRSDGNAQVTRTG
jgi:N-methylhydantoinase B